MWIHPINNAATRDVYVNRDRERERMACVCLSHKCGCIARFRMNE